MLYIFRVIITIKDVVSHDMNVFQYNQIWELSGKVCVHFLVLIMFVALRALWDMQEKNALSNCNCKEKGGGGVNVQWHGKISPGLSTHALEPLFSTLIHDVRRFFFLFLLGCDVLTQPISLNSDTVHTGSHLYLGSCSEHLPRKQSTCTPRLTGSSFQGTALLFTSYPYFSHHWNWR